MKKSHRGFRRSKTRNKKRRERSFATGSHQSLQSLQSLPERDQSVGSPSQRVREQDISSCRSLYYGAHIGNESRTLEFKQGGGLYLQNVFYKHVCVYGCAFLNGGGGSLLVGVYDSGVVCGINLNHKMADEVRLHVDDAVKTFQPALFPCNYTLDFVPVVKRGEGRHQLKVVRLTFTPPPAAGEPTLFQSGGGEVYMKRDGSVQGPLSVSCILEWNKLMWGSRVRQLEQSVFEARCEQEFLTGRFSWFTDPLHHIVASLPARVPGGQRWGRGSTAGALQPPPEDSEPDAATSCLKAKRRNTA